MRARVLLKQVSLLTTLLLATACTAKAPEATATAVTPVAAATAVATTAASVASTATASAASATTSATATTAKIAPPQGMPAGPAPVEGTDYAVIDTPDQPTGDKVRVVEVFGYGCPHCNAMQPYISAWEKKLPSDVQFEYLPAAFGPGGQHCWDEFARAFYAAQAMGFQAKSHDAIYKAIWNDHRFNTCSDIPALYSGYADPKVFASTMQSFAVSARINAARDQATRWGVDGTPTLIVDGKYRALETRDGGPNKLLSTVDWLIAKQRSEHARH